MRFDGDNQYRCLRCDGVVDIPMGAGARITIHDHRDDDRLRVLTLDGEKIHRCTFRTRSTRNARTGSAA